MNYSIHSNEQVAGSTTRFPSVHPPLMDTKFENFWSNSGATKSCILTGGLGVSEASLATIFHGTFATQESWFLLDEDIVHQQQTQLKMLPTAWGIRKNTRHYKTQHTDPIVWLTYLGCMCAAYLHHANYVPNLHKEFRNWRNVIEIHTA